MKYSLKTKLSLTIAGVVLLTVALISLLSNIFIGQQFEGYVKHKQERATQEIVNSISQQYQADENAWNAGLIHSIGMYALYEGYIIKVFDREGQVVWDAAEGNMALCSQIINDISIRMSKEYPKLNGELTSKEFPALQGSKKIGTVKISYFGPYFVNEEDVLFFDALNKILLGAGIFSLIFSAIIGLFLSRWLSRPLINTIAVTKEISEGNLGVRMDEDNSTKEVSDLIEAVNHLAKTLQENDHLRRQLTADVAHELRTPLTTVQTHLEALIEGLWDPTPERLQSCHDELIRLNRIVKDLEQLAKVESNNLKLDKIEVNLLDLSHKIIGNFERDIKHKNLHISVTGNCQAIKADKDRINQVLINLLSNAIKYTPDGGDIKINISETNDSVIFRITDNGVGISEMDIPYIFERFYRADKSRNRMTGGSGIGLAIVKSIVEAHGGTVHAESQFDKGSTFTVKLPKKIEQ